MLNLKHYAYSNACVSLMAVSIVIGSSGKSSTYHAFPTEIAKTVWMVVTPLSMPSKLVLFQELKNAEKFLIISTNYLCRFGQI